MALFMRNGSRFMVTTEEAMDLHEMLPAGTYTVKFDQMSGQYFLETITDFEVTGKIYGDTLPTRDRILQTFHDRPSSTGVMLSGEKGSGKTLLAKMLSIEARKQSIPTIVINQPWHGEGFNSFIQMIDQETIIIFDEFEKVYDKDNQESLLTLLDGVYPSKKLFVITCNDRWRVNEHMRNRPGRIYYRIDYTGLDTDFISEYCSDNLKDTSHIDAICRMSVLFQEFNFDILKALVEEMNRYGETPQAAMKMLNAKPEYGDRLSYKVALRVGGSEVPEGKIHNDAEWRGNPLNQTITVYYTAPAKPKQDITDILAAVPASDDDDDDDERYHTLRFSPTDLAKVDADTGQFLFTKREGVELRLTKVVPKAVDYSLVY